jgi:polyhydroxyalkanoate synthesis regulator phasin
MTNPINKILSNGGAALEMTRDTATELVNDLVKKGEVKREDAQVEGNTTRSIHRHKRNN